MSKQGKASEHNTLYKRIKAKSKVWLYDYDMVCLLFEDAVF